MTLKDCSGQLDANSPNDLGTPETDHQTVELENKRAKLVQTIHDIRHLAEQAAAPESRQQAGRLLSAAVEDLKRHDALLNPDLGNAL